MLQKSARIVLNFLKLYLQADSLNSKCSSDLNLANHQTTSMTFLFWQKKNPTILYFWKVFYFRHKNSLLFFFEKLYSQLVRIHDFNIYLHCDKVTHITYTYNLLHAKVIRITFIYNILWNKFINIIYDETI